MKDNVRAGLTAINMSFATLSLELRLSYLENAKNHFEEAMVEQQQPPIAPTPIRSRKDPNPVTNPITKPSHLSSVEISKYFKIVKLQIEVTTCLGKDILKSGSPEAYLNLFGRTQRRHSEIASLVLMNGNYNLGFLIIQEFALPATDIYSKVLCNLTRQKKDAKVTELLKTIQATITDLEMDQVLLSIVEIYGHELDDAKNGARFIAMMNSDHYRVRGHIACGKLKSAYIISARNNNIKDVVLIREEAVRTQSQKAIEFCDKFLSQGSADPSTQLASDQQD